MFSRLVVEALQVTVGGSILATCIAIDGNELTSHENPGQALTQHEESPPERVEQGMGCQSPHEAQHKGKEREVIPEKANPIARYSVDACTDTEMAEAASGTPSHDNYEDNTKTITRVDAMDMFALSSHTFAKMQCLEVAGPANTKRNTRKKLYLWNDVHQKALLHHGGEVGIEFTLNTKRISKGEISNQKQC
ncbi:hypothetical protein BJV82DRAFT_673023 [Fennellomyces sp. T-0311]|nr:hypothetical protein BJV82DRAFT_673023 [Fennellomyces sp. T-0311]